MSSNRNLLTYPLSIAWILIKIMFRQLIRNIMIYQNFPNFILPYQVKHFFYLMSLQEVLSKNFDQLQNVFSGAKIDFDLIGITETKQQVDKDFLVNVNITGYHM